jgi:hypothetical protein
MTDARPETLQSQRAFTDEELGAALAEIHRRRTAAGDRARAAAAWLARTESVRAYAEEDLHGTQLWPTPTWRIVVQVPDGGEPSPWLQALLPYHRNGALVFAEVGEVHLDVEVGPEAGLPPGTTYPVHLEMEPASPW